MLCHFALLFLHFEWAVWRLSGGLGLAGGVDSAGGFILGAEASSADVDFSFLTFYHNRSSVNIR